MEPTRGVRWTEAALMAVVVLFGGYRLAYVVAVVAVLIVAFTAKRALVGVEGSR